MAGGRLTTDDEERKKHSIGQRQGQSQHKKGVKLCFHFMTFVLTIGDCKTEKKDERGGLPVFSSCAEELHSREEGCNMDSSQLLVTDLSEYVSPWVFYCLHHKTEWQCDFFM